MYNYVLIIVKKKILFIVICTKLRLIIQNRYMKVMNTDSYEL